jgi:hypothetical protein
MCGCEKQKGTKCDVKITSHNVVSQLQYVEGVDKNGCRKFSPTPLQGLTVCGGQPFNPIMDEVVTCETFEDYKCQAKRYTHVVI